MPARRRIRNQIKNVTGSGGGGGGGGGNIAWGPDFGEGAGGDGNTFTIQTALDLDSVDLTGDLGVGVGIDSDSLAMVGNLGVATVLNLDLVGIDYGEALGVATALDLDSLAMESNLGIGIALTMPSLDLVGNLGVSTTLTGTATGAPFWQSVTTAAHTSVGNTSTLACNVPAGTQDGDLLIAVVTGQTGLANEWTASATGWTVIDNSTKSGAVGAGLGTLYRIASSEPASYTFSQGVSTAAMGVEIHRITGVAVTPVDVNGEATASAADPVAPSVTTTVANCLVFVCSSHSHTTGSTNTPPAGHDERTDFNSGTGVSLIGSSTSTRVFAATGATGTATVNCNQIAGSGYATQRIAVAPGTITLA